jgi:transposase-like protein
MSIILDGNLKRANDRVYGMRSVMECPWCKGYYDNYDAKKQTWKFDRWITPSRARYICGHCKHGVQYEMS